MKIFCPAALVLLLLAPCCLNAQEASSFEQLQVMVKPGDTVTVVDPEGNSNRGRIVELSPSSLRLLLNGTERSWGQSDVREIRQRRADSLANGALVGTIVGAVLGTLGAIGCTSEGDCSAGEAIAGLSFIVLSGTGAGTAIDALLVKQQTIYRRRQTASVRLSPLVWRQARGVSIQLSF